MKKTYTPTTITTTTTNLINQGYRPSMSIGVQYSFIMVWTNPPVAKNLHLNYHPGNRERERERERESKSFKTKTCVECCYTFSTSSFAILYSVLPARCGAERERERERVNVLKPKHAWTVVIRSRHRHLRYYTQSFLHGAVPRSHREPCSAVYIHFRICPLSSGPRRRHIKKGNLAPWIQRAKIQHLIACCRNLADVGIDKALRWAKIWNKSSKTKSCLDFSLSLSLSPTFVMHVCQWLAPMWDMLFRSAVLITWSVIHLV